MTDTTPSVNHIRLDDVQLTSTLPSLFGILLGVPIISPAGTASAAFGPSQARYATTISSQLSHLRLISICPLIEYRGRMQMHVAPGRVWSTDGMDSLARVSTERTDCCTLYMLPYREKCDVSFEEAFNGWLAIVGGGDGPWAPL